MRWHYRVYNNPGKGPVIEAKRPQKALAVLRKLYGKAGFNPYLEFVPLRGPRTNTIRIRDVNYAIKVLIKRIETKRG